MSDRFITIKECDNFGNVFPFFRNYKSIDGFKYVFFWNSSDLENNAFVFSNIHQIREVYLYLIENREKNKHWTKVYILFKRHIYTISLLKDVGDTTTLFLNEYVYFDNREGIFTKGYKTFRDKGFEYGVNDENRYLIFDNIACKIRKNLF